MPGLFDGSKEIVKQTFVDYDLEARGKTFTIADHYIRFSSLVKENRAQAERLIGDVMVRTYEHLSPKIKNEGTRKASRCRGRGRLRKEIELTPKRIIATFTTDVPHIPQ